MRRQTRQLISENERESESEDEDESESADRATHRNRPATPHTAARGNYPPPNGGAGRHESAAKKYQ